MKILLFYFDKFKKNGTILSKEYLDDFIIRVFGQWPIIIITYDKSIFSANDSY